jgi:PBP1b-binding outer membrane lipoprotein LpoB
MRKLLALAFVAVLALSSALFLNGCAKTETSDTSTSTETQPMSQPDTAVMDTTVHDSM